MMDRMMDRMVERVVDWQNCAFGVLIADSHTAGVYVPAAAASLGVVFVVVVVVRVIAAVAVVAAEAALKAALKTVPEPALQAAR